MQRRKTHLHKFSVALIPGHGQLHVRVIAAIDATAHRAQVKCTLLDHGAQKKILSESHSDGRKSAMD